MVYEYMPQKNIKKLTGMLVILISAAVGFFLFPSLFPNMPMRWIFQLTGMLCLVGVIFIATRYIGKALVYSILEDEEGLDFAVTEVTNGGRTRVTVCRFAIAEIDSIERVGTNSERKRALDARAKRERRKIFNYCAEIGDTNAYYVFLSHDGNDLLVKISPDSVILDYFTKKFNENTEV